MQKICIQHFIRQMQNRVEGVKAEEPSKVNPVSDSGIINFNVDSTGMK